MYNVKICEVILVWAYHRLLCQSVTLECSVTGAAGQTTAPDSAQIIISARILATAHLHAQLQ